MPAVPIRWLIRRDMLEVLDIENSAFREGHRWTEDDFKCHLRNRNCIGMVAEQDDEIVGYMVYELHKGRLCLLNLAVKPSCERQGVGRAMIQRLGNKLSEQRRSEIVATVYETDTQAVLFLRAMGFRATAVQRAEEDGEEDIYVMRFRLGDPAEQPQPPVPPKSRIEKYLANYRKRR